MPNLHVRRAVAGCRQQPPQSSPCHGWSTPSSPNATIDLTAREAALQNVNRRSSAVNEEITRALPGTRKGRLPIARHLSAEYPQVRINAGQDPWPARRRTSRHKTALRSTLTVRRDGRADLESADQGEERRCGWLDDCSSDCNEQHQTALEHHLANAACPRRVIQSGACMHLLIAGSSPLSPATARMLVPSAPQREANSGHSGTFVTITSCRWSHC